MVICVKIYCNLFWAHILNHGSDLPGVNSMLPQMGEHCDKPVASLNIFSWFIPVFFMLEKEGGGVRGIDGNKQTF